MNEKFIFNKIEMDLLNENRFHINDFVKMSIVCIGRADTVAYINHISDILNSEYFYDEHCKVPLLHKKVWKNGEIQIKKNCPLTKAYQKYGNKIWVTFHPDWRNQFAKFVIRKGVEVLYITRDPNYIRKVLNLSEKIDC